MPTERTTEYIPDEVVSVIFSEKLEDAVETSSTGGPTFTHLLQSVMLPSRVAVSAFRTPFRIAFRGRRLPSWSTQMEVVVAAFRSACKNAPRDLSMLRAWTNLSVPSLLLPEGAILHSSSLHGMTVDWVFPHALTKNSHPKGKRRMSASLFSNDTLLEWSKTHPIVLYIHGGAFCLCGSNTHRNIISSFAMEDLVLFAPNYRRPPDVSIIDAVDDCVAAYKHLVVTLGIPPERIAVMGDSAGASLSILSMCRIRDEQKSLLPSCVVLLSPWCDLDDKDIMAEAAKGVIMPPHDYLPFDAIALISKWVLGSHSPDDPRINPMWANLDGLPDFLIHAGGVEVLFNQITRFYDKCKDTEGLNVRMKVWADMPHVPHTFTHVSETAVLAVQDAALFIKDKVAKNGSF